MKEVRQVLNVLQVAEVPSFIRLMRSILVTVSILIGNTDNRLTQKEWSKFVEALRVAIEPDSATQHFFGTPPNYAPQQNACWVIEIEDQHIESLKRSVTDVRERFKQESAAMLFGHTEFV